MPILLFYFILQLIVSFFCFDGKALTTGRVVGVAGCRYFFHSRKLGEGVNMGQLGTKRSFWNGVVFNICTTALKQMAFYPTQEVLKRVLIDKGLCVRVRVRVRVRLCVCGCACACF
jgi:hypothetical protein